LFLPMEKPGVPLSVAGGIAVPSGAAVSPRTRPKATASARLVISTLSGFCTGRIAATQSQQKSTSPRLDQPMAGATIPVMQITTGRSHYPMMQAARHSGAMIHYTILSL
jgi:hypothetical protein